MATTWKAPTWRMPNEKNQSKFESYSLDFDGSSEHINVSANSIFNFGTGDFTLSAWIKVDSFSPSYYPYILDFRTSSTANERAVAFYLDDNGILQVWIEGSLKIGSSGTALAANTWHNVILKRESGTLSTHINGGSADQTVTYTGDMNTTPPLTIGARAGNIQAINGAISQVSIFNYALSSTQISSLYNSGSPINPMTLKPAPIAYYPLGGNASTGGNIGSDTLSVPNVAVPDASVFDFVQSSTPYDYINLGEDVIPSTPAWTSLTVSGWVKKDAAGNFGRVIGKDDGGSNRVFLLQVQSNEVLSGSIRTAGGSWQNLLTTTQVAIGEWQHVAMTFEGGQAIKLFINGEEEADASTTIASLLNGTTDTLIGAKGGPANLFDGQISNVQIWDVALTNPEMLQIYNNGQPLMTGTQPQEANLKAWYKLDQSANWEADTVGNWQIPDAVSSYPQSFDFSKTAQEYIDLSKDDWFNEYNNEITFSVWVNKPNWSSSGFEGIISKYGTSGSTIQYRIAYPSSANQLQFYLQGGPSGGPYSARINTVTLTSAQTNPDWLHILWRHSASTNTSQVIFNGDHANAVSLTNIAANPYAQPQTTTTNMIGNVSNGLQPFDGAVSNYQRFNSYLDNTAVEALYNNGVPSTTAIASTNSQAWYKLDNTEKFDGTDWSIENQKYPASYESALKFPGPSTGNKISFSPLTINVTQANTYSAWVYPIGGTSFWTIIAGAYSGTTPNIGPISLNSAGGSSWAIRSTQNAMNQAAKTVTSNSISNSELGKWHHIMVVVDNLDVSFYLNGQPHGTATFNDAWTSSTIDLFSIGQFSNWVPNGYMSNVAIWNSDQSTNIANIYNNGTPQNSYTVEPIALWRLDNTTTGLNDIIGGKNGTLTGDITKVNTFVSTEAGASSGMTEQNLVNNNVSVLNGESSGMDTSNLVTSTLTRQVPYNSYSLYFDGTSDYVEVPDDASLKPTSAITCSMWFNCGTQNTNRHFLSKYYDTVDGAYGFYTNGSSSDLYFYVTVGGTTYDSPVGSGFFDDNWHHAVGVYDGANIYLYVDGVQQGTSTAQTGSISYNNGILCFASLAGAPTSYEVDTYLNNISIFNEALTSTEILKLYNSGVPSDLSSFNPQPVSWWSLGSDSYFNGTNYICPDLIGTNNSNASNGLSANSLVGNAPNSSANGTSTNMTIDANLTGSAPNSSNNSFSVNMSYDDRVSGSGDVPS